MNKLTIIGNLTRDPELRTTSAGVNVCDFTVAVNRRQRRDAQNGQPEADFFRVSAWRERGELCAKYLAKGRKVCVVGPVSVRTYTGNDGTTPLLPKLPLQIPRQPVSLLWKLMSCRSNARKGGNDQCLKIVAKEGRAPAEDAVPAGRFAASA